MISPNSTIDDSEAKARMNIQMNERFKSLSIRNIKNKTVVDSTRGSGLNRRRNIGGLKDFGNKTRNFSPNISENIDFTPKAFPTSLNITKNLLSNDSSLQRTQKEEPENFIF